MPRLLTVSAGLLALALTAGPAPAQTTTCTWTGAGGDGNWSTGANWGGTAPAPSLTDTRISLAGLTNTSTTIDAAYGDTLQVLGLTFAANAGPFTVGSGGTVLEVGAEGVVNNSGQDQVVSAPVRLGANQTWSSFAQFKRTRFTGPMDLNGFDLTLGATSSTLGGWWIDLLDPVSGSGRLTVVGRATLRGANTYSGGTLVDSPGTDQTASLYVDSAANLGTGPVELRNRGTLVFEAAADSTLAGPLLVTGGSAGFNEWNTLRVDQAGTTLRLQPGGLQGSGGRLVVSGPGTVVLTGANPFAGELYTSAGRLELIDSGGGASLAALQVWVDSGHLHVGPGARLLKAPGYYEPYVRVEYGGSAHFAESQTLTEMLLWGTVAGGEPTVTTAPGVSLTLLQGLSGYAGTVNASLAGTTAGTYLTKRAGTGVLTVSGQSTFTGTVFVESGVLSVDSLKPTGQPSALGAGGGIVLYRFQGGASTLRYTGPSTTTDRLLQVVGIDSQPSFLEVTDRAAALTWAGPLTYSTNTSVPRLQKTGAGTLVIASTGNSFYVPGAGGGNGKIGVQFGTLSVTGSVEAEVAVDFGATASGKLVGANTRNYRVVVGGGAMALTAKAGGTVRAGLGSSTDVLGVDGVQFDAGSKFAVTVDGGAVPTASKILNSTTGNPISFSPVASTGRITLQLEKGAGAEFVPGQPVTVEIARGGIYKKVSGAYNAFTYNADEWTPVAVGFDIVPGSFSLFTTENGNVLNAQFTPVPEPGLVLTFGTAILAGAAIRRRGRGT
jgi:autotransporter-associated beta strand protein